VEEYLNEKEQWQQVLAWLREQGPWILGGVAIALAAFGGWHFWQNRTQQRDLAAASRYQQVMDAFERHDMGGGVQLADGLVKAFPGTAYADQANLAVARIQVESRQLDQAAARLQQVLGATRDAELALIARLRLARVQLAQARRTMPENTRCRKAGRLRGALCRGAGRCAAGEGDRDGALKAYREARGGAAGTLDSGLLDLKIGELARS